MVRYAWAGDLLGELSRNWWLVVLRGVAAVLFGLVALIWPGKTLVVLAVVFGAYALVDAAALGYAAYRSSSGVRVPLVVQAVLSAIVGLVALVWPVAAIVALVFVIGVWAVVTGVAEIVTAVRLRAHISSEWLLVFVGALSVVFGLLLWFWPLEGAQAIMFVIAMYAVIFGAVMAVAGFRLRGAAEAFLAPEDAPAFAGLGEPEEPAEPYDHGTRPGDLLEDRADRADNDDLDRWGERGAGGDGGRWEDPDRGTRRDRGEAQDDRGGWDDQPGGRHRAPGDEGGPDEPR
ncbi:HdeD family acid-resistance protein [Nocardiopsis deserti]|uniref:HdeD family acid-resistance protein n=1 Tax=Nocardiopsis deserti TaxID=2605988 RepID=UPI001238F223|nr:HdeD family acid-resistance protein [Nocardiopsis deserti]